MKQSEVVKKHSSLPLVYTFNEEVLKTLSSETAGSEKKKPNITQETIKGEIRTIKAIRNPLHHYRTELNTPEILQNFLVNQPVSIKDKAFAIVKKKNDITMSFHDSIDKESMFKTDLISSLTENIVLQQTHKRLNRDYETTEFREVLNEKPKSQKGGDIPESKDINSYLLEPSISEIERMINNIIDNINSEIDSLIKTSKKTGKKNIGLSNYFEDYSHQSIRKYVELIKEKLELIKRNNSDNINRLRRLINGKGENEIKEAIEDPTFTLRADIVNVNKELINNYILELMPNEQGEEEENKLEKEVIKGELKELKLILENYQLPRTDKDILTYKHYAHDNLKMKQKMREMLIDTMQESKIKTYGMNLYSIQASKDKYKNTSKLIQDICDKLQIKEDEKKNLKLLNPDIEVLNNYDWNEKVSELKEEDVLYLSEILRIRDLINELNDIKEGENPVFTRKLKINNEMINFYNKFAKPGDKFDKATAFFNTQTGGATKQDKLQIINMPIKMKINDKPVIHVLITQPLKTDMAIALFEIYNKKIGIMEKAGKQTKKLTVSTATALDDLYENSYIVDIVSSLSKQFVSVSKETLDFIQSDKNLQNYAGLRFKLTQSIFENYTVEKFINKLAKKPRFSLSSPEINNYTQEQLKGLENSIYYYKEEPIFKKQLKTKDISALKMLDSAIEDRRNQIVKKDSKPSMFNKFMTSVGLRERSITNEEAMDAMVYLNNVKQTIQAVSEKENEKVNEIPGLGEKIKVVIDGHKENKQDKFELTITPDDADKLLEPYKDIAIDEFQVLDSVKTDKGISLSKTQFIDNAEKYIKFLTENAEGQNIELMDMAIADENGEKWLELSKNALKQYVMFTEKILEANERSGEEQPQSEINVILKQLTSDENETIPGHVNIKKIIKDVLQNISTLTGSQQALAITKEISNDKQVISRSGYVMSSRDMTIEQKIQLAALNLPGNMSALSNGLKVLIESITFSLVHMQVN